MRRAAGEGAAVTVHYLATVEAGTVERVQDGGRTVIVVTESDAGLEFRLTATAQFWTPDRSAHAAPSPCHGGAGRQDHRGGVTRQRRSGGGHRHARCGERR